MYLRTYVHAYIELKSKLKNGDKEFMTTSEYICRYLINCIYVHQD